MQIQSIKIVAKKGKQVLKKYLYYNKDFLSRAKSLVLSIFKIKSRNYSFVYRYTK